MRRLILWLPLVLFLAFVIVVAIMLREPSSPVIRSKMVGKPLPTFALAPAAPGKPGLSSRDLAQGKPRLLNVFASWCIPCAVEAPQLMRLAQMGIPIDAVAIRDRPEDVRAFLQRWGDPFQRVGSSGVPESFIIDGKGVIRYQHIGDIRAEQIPEIMRQFEAAQ